jgi:hypothetical protein
MNCRCQTAPADAIRLNVTWEQARMEPCPADADDFSPDRQSRAFLVMEVRR